MDINSLCMGCMKEIKEQGETCPYCGYRALSIPDDGHCLKPYTILNGKYLVGRVLGEGGFGITYIGFDLNLEVPVAVKEFYPNGYVTRETGVTATVSAYAGTDMGVVRKWLDNFLREAKTLAKFANLPGIVGVKDFFEENCTAYIVMEYLEGRTLKEYIRMQGGRLAAEQLLYALNPVMTALSQIHQKGLIHRDISPDNIMLLPDGSMKLLDFGAARDYVADGEKSLSIMLKPGYAPEEQYRTKGKQGPWSDVYAIAATIYKCITGVTPPESMERMRQDTLLTPRELGIPVSYQMETALLKGMAVYAESRYQSMQEFKEALSVQKGHATIAAIQQETLVMQEQKKTQSSIINMISGRVYGIAACAAVLLAIAVVFILLNPKEADNVQEEPMRVEDNIQTMADPVSLEADAPEQIDFAAVFGIHEEDRGDYSTILVPQYYRYYNSEISDFSFWYAEYFYNNVTVDEEARENGYGENIQTISFTASDGSELIYSLLKRSDGRSLEEMVDYAYTCEYNSLSDPIDLGHFVEEDYGKVCVTGWKDRTHEKVVYELVKIEQQYVMQMKVICPDYIGETDKLQKTYVTECYYRLCGFSKSDAVVRSYSEYVEASIQ